MPKLPLVAIVDDDKDQVAMLNMAFSIYGIPVAFVAYSGYEAISLFESSKVKPDVILIDIRMNNSNGIDAARQILAISNNVNVIMLSADEWRKKEALEAGAKMFISKPASIRTILNEVTNTMKK